MTDQKPNPETEAQRQARYDLRVDTLIEGLRGVALTPEQADRLRTQINLCDRQPRPVGLDPEAVAAAAERYLAADSPFAAGREHGIKINGRTLCYDIARVHDSGHIELIGLNADNIRLAITYRDRLVKHDAETRAHILASLNLPEETLGLADLRVVRIIDATPIKEN